MFKGRTAWFSSSVEPKRARLWKQHDGKIVSLDKAQFVFSDDCQSPDTKRLYESDAYINEHLAIFHSSYISECVKKEDIKSVVLGDYFLPPLEVMEVIRGQIKFEWEKHTSQSDGSDGASDSEETTQSRSRSGTTSSAGSSRSENEPIIVDSEQTNSQQRHSQGASRDKDLVHIDSLPKVTGVLEEFCPGKNGCVVFMKS